MIGAMQAVALRHERKKQESKTRPLNQRPSHLHLPIGGIKGNNNSASTMGLPGSSPRSPGSPGSRGPSRPGSPGSLTGHHSPTHTPQNANKGSLSSNRGRGRKKRGVFILGKNAILYLIVILMLLGIIILIVGLVQLKPGADANGHKFYIISAGCFLIGIGVIMTGARCCCYPDIRIRKTRSGQHHMKREPDSSLSMAAAHQHDEKLAAQNGGSLNKRQDEVVHEPSGPDSPTHQPKVDSNNGALPLTGGLTPLKSPSEHDALIQAPTSPVDNNHS